MRDRFEFTGILIAGLLLFGAGSLLSRATPSRSTEDVLTVDLPAAMAVQPPTYPDGGINPDYRDMAIATLQHANRELNRTIREQQDHDADIHRGNCVPWEEK